MADDGARVYGPAQPGTSNATLYTVPGSTTLHVLGITLVNTTNLLATMSLAINGTAATAANAWLAFALPVPPNGLIPLDVFTVLEAADTIQGLQGTASAITVTISGVLVT